MDHFTRITTAESLFAKEVVLNVFYLRPTKLWQNLIPGMFLFDFLRRGSAVRRYTKKYMFPRNLALDAVRDLSSGFGTDAVDRRVQERIEAELQPLQLPSTALAHAYHGLIKLLTEHYGRLARAQGETYDQLVRNAYPTAGEYENHLRLLTAAENDVDKAVVEVAGQETSLGEDLQLEADQVAASRRKVLERIF